MKSIQHFIPLLLLLFLLAGCNKDEEETTENYPKCVTITETTGSGEEEVTTQQQFLHDDNGQLTQHITTQTYTDRWLEAKYTHTVITEVSYEPGKVIVTDEFGTVSTYILDDHGRATNCIRNEPGGSVRTYLFTYSSQEGGNLTGIKESINNNPYSEISITTPQVGVMDIKEDVDTYHNSFTASINDNNPGISNAQSRFPWLFLPERYPLSFHVEALYANILGEPLSILPGRLEMEGSDEITTYTYSTDTKGYITSCTVMTSVPGKSWNRLIGYSYQD